MPIPEKPLFEIKHEFLYTPCSNQAVIDLNENLTFLELVKALQYLIADGKVRFWDDQNEDVPENSRLLQFETEEEAERFEKWITGKGYDAFAAFCKECGANA